MSQSSGMSPNVLAASTMRDFDQDKRVVGSPQYSSCDTLNGLQCVNHYLQGIYSSGTVYSNHFKNNSQFIYEW